MNEIKQTPGGNAYEQYNQVRSTYQQLAGLQGRMDPAQQKLFKEVGASLPKLRPAPDYHKYANLFESNRFNSDTERKAAVQSFATTYLPEDSADPLADVYGGRDKVPTDLNKIVTDFGKAARARYNVGSLYGKDQETVDAAVSKKADEMKSRAELMLGAATTTVSQHVAWGNRKPVDLGISDAEWLQRARTKLFQDDRVLQLNTYMEDLSPATQRIVRTAPFSQDLRNFESFIRAIPVDERPAAVAAMQLSNPANDGLWSHFVAAGAEAYRGGSRFLEEEIYEIQAAGRDNFAFDYVKTLEKELGRDLTKYIDKDGQYTSPEAREAVAQAMTKHKFTSAQDVRGAELVDRLPGDVAEYRAFLESQQIGRLAERALSPRLSDDASLGRDMATTTAELIPFTAGVALASFAGGLPAGFAMGYTLQHDSIRASYMDAGFNSKDAALLADIMTVPVAAAEYLGAVKVFKTGINRKFVKGLTANYKRVAGEIIYNKFVDGIEEVGTEVVQQIIEDSVLVFAKEFKQMEGVEGMSFNQAFDNAVAVAKETLKGMPGLLAGPAAVDLGSLGIHKATGGAVSMGQPGAYMDIENAAGNFRAAQDDVRDRLNVELGPDGKPQSIVEEDADGNAVIVIPEELQGNDTPAVPASVYEAYRAATTEEERAKILEEAEYADGAEALGERIGVMQQIEAQVIDQARAEVSKAYQEHIFGRDANGQPTGAFGKRMDALARSIQGDLDAGATMDTVLAELIAKHNGGNANVVVVNNPMELLDLEISDRVKSLVVRGETLDGFVEGGTVYLVKQGLDRNGTGPAMAVAKYAHEFLIHQKLDGLGAAGETMLNQAASVLAEGGFLSSIAEGLIALNPIYYAQFANPDGSMEPARVAEEWIARIAEGLLDPATMELKQQKGWEKVRSWIGQHLGIETVYEWSDRQVAALAQGIMTQATTTMAPAPMTSPQFSVGGRDTVGGDIGDGRGYTDFFGNFHDAKGDEWFYPRGEYTPAIEMGSAADEFQKARGEYMGHFDTHIATSIPGFSDLQAIVGDALNKTYGQSGATVLDIGTSEGALIKALAKLSESRITSVGIDPNVGMQATFNEKDTPGGVEFKLEALGTQEERGQKAWTEEDGTEINYYDPGDQQFDVIHEAMVFQFMSADRADHINIVKSMMAPDGVAIFEEKFGTELEEYNKNEDEKDFKWKSKYYTQEQIEQKRREVLERGGDTIEGMTKLQVTVQEMDKILTDNFKHYATFWQSGNFRGYAASDSQAQLQKLLDNMQDTDSEFGQATKEIVSEAKFSVEERRKANSDMELQSMGVSLREDGLLQMTHWTDKADIDVLDPEQFGTGPLNGVERRRAGGGFVNRIFYGLSGYRKEVEGTVRYNAAVDTTTLYPLMRDPDGLKESAKGIRGYKGNGEPIYGGVDINKYERAVRDAGYQGIIGTGNYGPVVAMFEKVTPDSRVEGDDMEIAPTEVDGEGMPVSEKGSIIRNGGVVVGSAVRSADGQFSVGPAPVDTLGFYSPSGVYISGLQVKSQSAQAWINQIRGANKKGLVKSEELEDIGLYDWLESQEGKVTKEAVVSFIENGGVKLSQVVLGEPDPAYDVTNPDNWVGRDHLNERVVQLYTHPLLPDFEVVHLGGDTFRVHRDNVIVAEGYGSLADAIRGFGDDIETPEGPTTKHEQYQMEGPATNYREFIMTLPQRAPQGALTVRQVDGDAWYIFRGETQLRQAYSTEERARDFLPDVARGDADLVRRADVYTKTSHWPGIDNPIVHFRTNDRRVDGARALFLEEIQSDWIQDGRKRGFAREGAVEYSARSAQGELITQNWSDQAAMMDRVEALGFDPDDVTVSVDDVHLGVPDPGAFKKSGTVELLAFKRALAIAVAEGYESIAWTPAIEQIKRWSDDLQQAVNAIEWDNDSQDAVAEQQAILESRQQTLAETEEQYQTLKDRYNTEGGVLSDSILSARLALSETMTRLKDGIAQTQTVIDSMTADRSVQVTRSNNQIFSLYYDADGKITRQVGASDKFIGESLDDILDPALAKQIRGEDSGKLEGDDLTIGGKGFKDIYDRMLPKIVGKYVKSMGGKVEVGKTATQEARGMLTEAYVVERNDGTFTVGYERDPMLMRDIYQTREEAQEVADEDNTPSGGLSEEVLQDVWKVDITEQMRDEVATGQPRYSLQAGGDQGMTLPNVTINAAVGSGDERFSFGPLAGVDAEPDRIFRKALNGVDKFIFASDRTRVGTYTGLDPESGISIKLQGGPAYPFTTGNAGNAAWAVKGLGMGNEILTRAMETDGVGLITLFARDNAMANATFAMAYMAEARHAISKGALSKTRFLTVANQLRVSMKAGYASKTESVAAEMKAGKPATAKRKAVAPSSNADISAYRRRRSKAMRESMMNSKWATLEDMDVALQAATFEVRKKYFFGYSKTKKGANKGTKIGADNLIAEGFPNISDMLDLFVDRSLDDLEAGMIIGAVKFDTESGPVSAAEAGVEAHESYPLVLKGKGIGMFKDPIHVQEAVAGLQGKTRHAAFRSSYSGLTRPTEFSAGETADPALGAPNPTQAAALNFAVRILNDPDTGLNRTTAKDIAAKQYPGAQVDTALFQAYATARKLKPNWQEVKNRSAQEASRLVAQTANTVDFQDRVGAIYDDARTSFQKEYLRGGNDSELRNRAERNRTEAAAKSGLNKAELEDAGLWVTDPVEQLIVDEEAIRPPKKADDDDGEAEDDQVEVTEENVLEVTEVPQSIVEYLENVKQQVAIKTGLTVADPNFMPAYRATLTTALKGTVRSLTYGRNREALLNSIDALGNLVQLQAIERRAGAILFKTFQAGAQASRKQLISSLKKTINKRLPAKKARKTTGSWTKDSVDKLFLRQMRAALKMIDMDPIDVEERLAAIQGELDNGLPLYHQTESRRTQPADEYVADLQLEQEMLQRFGALNKGHEVDGKFVPYKTMGEVQEVVDTAIAEIEDAVAAQKERLTIRRAQMQSRRDMVTRAVKAGEGKAKRGPLAEALNTAEMYPMSLDALLQDIIRFAPPSTRAALWNDNVIQEGALWSLKLLSRNAMTAQNNIRQRKAADMNGLISAIKSIYGITSDAEAHGKLRALGKLEQRFSKFSHQGNKQPLSIAHLMQLVAYMEQDWYRDNWEKDFGGGARINDYDALLGELSEQDLALITWMRDFYYQQRPELSAKKQAITGLPFPPDLDDNYMPVGIDKLGGFRGVNTSLQVTPAVYSERVRHSEDIVEDNSMLDLFFDRSHKNATFLELAELSIDVQDIFGDKDVQKAIRDTYGKKYLTFLMQMLFDTMSQKPLRQDVDGISKGLLNYGAVVMTFNIGSAIRQPSSMWEFAMDHGVMQTASWGWNWLKPGLTPYIADMWRSQEAVDRYGQGQSYEMAAAFEANGVGIMKSWMNKYGMAPNKFMDRLTISVIGAGAFKKYHEHFRSIIPDPVEAKRMAMEWTWAEIEGHQQSSFVSNRAPWQRSGGALAKAVGMFSSTPQQFLSIQNAAIRHGRATGDWRPMAQSIIIHHVLGPAMYKAIETIFLAAFGRPPEEDEWKEWIAFMIVGPYSGAFVGRTILSFGIDKLFGIEGFSGLELMPAERGVEQVVSGSIDALTAIAEGDGEAVLEAAHSTAKILAPYRYASDLVENYGD